MIRYTNSFPNFLVTMRPKPDLIIVDGPEREREYTDRSNCSKARQRYAERLGRNPMDFRIERLPNHRYRFVSAASPRA